MIALIDRLTEALNNQKLLEHCYENEGLKTALDKNKTIHLLATGKSSYEQVRLVESFLKGKNYTLGDSLTVAKNAPSGLIGSHPVPDERSLKCGRAVISWLEERKKEDQVLYLLSGGSSSSILAPLFKSSRLRRLNSSNVNSG